MRPNSLLSVPITAIVTLLFAEIAQLVATNVLKVLVMLRAFIAWTQLSLGFGIPKRWIMMADDEDNFKDRFKYLIVAIVVLVVGAVTVSIVSGVGLYIIGVFNTTAVKIPSNYNFIGPIAPALGSIFQILVVVLIIVALIYVIRYLMRSTDTF